VWVQEDTFQRHAPTLLRRLIFQDGPYQKQEEPTMLEEHLIEIRPMIPDQHSVGKLTPRIELVQTLTSDQAIEDRHINLEHSRIRCKVAQALSYTIPNGETTSCTYNIK
jgi:hypothetical protein